MLRAKETTSFLSGCGREGTIQKTTHIHATDKSYSDCCVMLAYLLMPRMPCFVLLCRAKNTQGHLRLTEYSLQTRSKRTSLTTPSALLSTVRTTTPLFQTLHCA